MLYLSYQNYTDISDLFFQELILKQKLKILPDGTWYNIIIFILYSCAALRKVTHMTFFSSFFFLSNLSFYTMEQHLNGS